MTDERDIAVLAGTVSRLDRDVAVIQTELHGMHTEMTELKDDTKSARRTGEETRERVLNIESEARGAYRLLMIVQVLVGLLVAFGAVMALRE